MNATGAIFITAEDWANIEIFLERTRRLLEAFDKKQAFLLALRKRLDHSLSAGVETWPEYNELVEETTP